MYFLPRYQDKDVHKMKDFLNKKWFADNKLSIHFGENKTKIEKIAV